MANKDQLPDSNRVAVTEMYTHFQRPSRVEALPSFIFKLQEKGLLGEEAEEREEFVLKSCNIYTMARFKDGVSKYFFYIIYH